MKRNAETSAAHSVRISFVFVLIGMVALLSFAAVLPASEEVMKGGGTLTSVEADGSVIINGKGYEVAYSAQVIDWQGYSSFLDKFNLPARVYFEYVQNGARSVITLIREIPQ